jgi:hypothetical protein
VELLQEQEVLEHQVKVILAVLEVIPMVVLVAVAELLQ